MFEYYVIECGQSGKRYRYGPFASHEDATSWVERNKPVGCESTFSCEEVRAA